MKRNATLALCLAARGTAVEARADCQYLRGGIAETRISQGTEPTRILEGRVRVIVCDMSTNSLSRRRAKSTTLRAMAKTYRPYVPEQDRLLPPSLRDWLPEDHLAYFVSDLIDQLDLSAITAIYEDEERAIRRITP
jgi:hypothetical protein